MRKLFPTFALLSVILLSSCYTGPRYASRTVDDWHNNLYVDSPLLAGALTIVPVVQLGEVIAGVVDFVVLNPVQFWFHDIWTGEGAGFQHDNPESEKRHWLHDGGE